MRITTIRRSGGTRLCVVDGHDLWPVEVLNTQRPVGEPIPVCALTFIERFDDFRDAVTEALQAVRESKESTGATPIPVVEAAFAPPIPNARKLLCVAGNYADHIVEGGGQAPGEGDVLPPRVFMKPPSTTMIGSGEPVVLARNSVAVDWELELGVVIGRRARHVTPEEAKKCVFGYTIVNDISERRFDPGPRNKDREGDWFFDWINGKWFDTFAPVGPFVVTASDVPDPQNLAFSLEINGVVYQESTTARMIDDVYTLVSFFSRIMTLEPGDIIATGTPAGVGDAQGRYLEPGDVMKGTIEGLGTLVNPVVREDVS